MWVHVLHKVRRCGRGVRKAPREGGTSCAGYLRLLRLLCFQQEEHEEVPLLGHQAEGVRVDRAGRHPQQGRCGAGRRWNEALGHGHGRHALHPLVPASDRRHGREARLLRGALRKGGEPGGVHREAPLPAGARCVVLPQRGTQEHLRGQGIHSMGSLLARVRHGGHAVHPHGFHLIHRGGPGLQGAPPEVRGGHRQGDRRRPQVLRNRGRVRVLLSRMGAGVLPRGRLALRDAPRHYHGREDPGRTQPPPGTSSWRTTTSAASPAGSWSS